MTREPRGTRDRPGSLDRSGGSGDRGDSGPDLARRIPARVPARVGALESLRTVMQAMIASGLGAVLVESPLGPTGFLTAMDVIEAVAGGADPDTVWAGEIARPAPRTVSCTQHPADVGEEMTAYELEVVAVIDENAAVGVASALDVLSAVLRLAKEPTDHHRDR
ncbi:MAG TPA: CBS domain-containing protein [Acidimicrobiales bacterium]|nr:CBS domain-containing protein [Acidimicrobiales bacterium]HLN41466.1 CBS domain-containing protein [Acidimicrobiales bacterium]